MEMVYSAVTSLIMFELNGCTVRENNSTILVLVPLLHSLHLLNGSQLLKETIFSMRRKFSPLRLDSLLKGLLPPGKRNISPERHGLLSGCRKSLEVYPFF